MPAEANVWNQVQPGFDALAEQIWDPLGRALVDAAGLQPGLHVADVCAGQGASAHPAAQLMGAGGRLDVVDSSAAMLATARQRLAADGGAAAHFHQQDAVDFAAAHRGEFDAVLCGFGVFFLTPLPPNSAPGEQVSAGLAALLSMLKPEGKLAVSTWDGRPFEPLASLLVNTVQSVTGTLVTASDSARAIGSVNSESKLRGLAEALSADHLGGGSGSIVLSSEPVTFQLSLDADFAWQLVHGSLMADLLPTDITQRKRIQRDFSAAVEGLAGSELLTLRARLTVLTSREATSSR